MQFQRVFNCNSTLSAAIVANTVSTAVWNFLVWPSYLYARSFFKSGQFRIQRQVSQEHHTGEWRLIQEVVRPPCSHFPSRGRHWHFSPGCSCWSQCSETWKGKEQTDYKKEFSTTDFNRIGIIGTEKSVRPEFFWSALCKVGNCGSGYVSSPGIFQVHW